MDAEGATIVPAYGPDTDELARLHARCFDEVWDRATFARLLGSPGVFGLLARRASATLGFALVRVAGDEAELLTLGVDPSERRRGLARRLTERAIDGARIRGARALFLEVAADNDAARALYASLSFERVGLRKGYYARGPAKVDALTLRHEIL
jgi:ribosomal-protein-alanine N-acetyltransferase